MHVQVTRIEMHVHSHLMHHVFVASCGVVVHWMLFLCWVAPGSESEYVDPGEYVQDEQEQFQAEDITGKMTVTLIPYLALLCLESRFLRYMLAAYHLI